MKPFDDHDHRRSREDAVKIQDVKSEDRKLDARKFKMV